MAEEFLLTEDDYNDITKRACDSNAACGTDIKVSISEAEFVLVVEKLDPILLDSKVCPFITLTDTKVTGWRMIPEDKWQEIVAKAKEIKKKQKGENQYVNI